MDGQRFDRVARLIGAGASRRFVLKSLLGGAGGIALGAIGRTESSAQGCIETGQACEFDQECCGERCTEQFGVDGKVCQDCVGEGSSCRGFTCCPNLQCDAETLTCIPLELGCGFQGAECGGDNDCCLNYFCANGLCTLTCSEEGGQCFGPGVVPADAFIPCCNGFTCSNEGVCELAGGPSCVESGNSCEESAECCSGLTCIDGFCGETCVELGGNCDLGTGTNGACCEGLACNASGVCEEIAAPVACENDGECGDGEICCDSACYAIECCLEDEDPNARCGDGSTCFEGQCVFACKGDADCASGTCCCTDGTCDAACCNGGVKPEKPAEPVDTGSTAGGVTSLPSTGSGAGESGIGGLLGAGLAAGVAAYLAGSKLKSQAKSEQS